MQINGPMFDFLTTTHSRIYITILFIFMLHASGFLWGLVYIFTYNTGLYEGVSIIRTLSWLIFYGIAVVSLLSSYGSNWIFWLIRKRFIIFTVVAFATASALWSIAPVLTLERSVHLAGTTLFAFYIGYHFSINVVYKTLGAVLVLNVILGMIVALLFPVHGQMVYDSLQVWRGLQGDKNNFAGVCTVGFLFYFVRLLRPVSFRLSEFIICIICIINIWMADSKTALISLFCATGVIFLLRYGDHNRALTIGALNVFVGVGALALFLFAVIAHAPVWDPAVWTNLAGRAENLSGRTEIWGPAWQAALRNPMLGYGYGTIWFPREELEYVQQFLLETHWTAFHGHNVFLHVAPEIGLIAATAVTVFIVLTFFETLKYYFISYNLFALFIIAFEIAVLIKNISEATLLVDRSFEWILFIALPLLLIRSHEGDDRK